MILDKDTQALQLQAEQLKGMLESEGWTIAKAKLDERILDLQNINNLDVQTPDALVADIRARKMAVDILYAFLKADLYGFVEQQDAAKDAMRDGDAGSFIGR
jgi:hypothetical protein